MDSLEKVFKGTFAHQRSCMNRIKSAHDTYCKAMNRANEDLKGQAYEDEFARVWGNYRDTRTAALASFDVNHDRAFDALRDGIMSEASQPPNSAANNVLTAFSMRSKLDKGDVEAAVKACSGSFMALSTLRDVVHRVSPDCDAYLPVIPSLSEVLDTIEKQREARRESMHNYLDETPGQTSAASELRNELFDPESGLQSFFKVMEQLSEVLNGGE